MSFTKEDLDQMRTGAIVQDAGTDKWTKSADGTWGVSGWGDSYQGWSSDRLVVHEGPITLPGQEMPQITSDVLRPPSEYVSEARTRVRAETLNAQTAWLDEGYESELFDKGIQNGWFTDRFFSDLASGEAF